MESENRTFENSWEKAFSEAEIAPDSAVWTKIVLGLANKESGKFRRSLLFFKLLAAASVTLAASLVGMQYFQAGIFGPSGGNEEAQFDPKEYVNNEDLIISFNTDASQTAEERRSNDSGTLNSLQSASANQEVDIHQYDNSLGTRIISDTEKYSKEPVMTALTSSSSERVYEVSSVVHELTRKPGILVIADPTVPQLNKVPWISLTDEKKHYAGVWAGIGMSTGSFTSLEGGSDVFVTPFSVESDNQQAGYSQEEVTGNVIQIGGNVGMAVSRKVVLQSGLALVRQSTTSFSNMVSHADGDFSTVSNVDEMTDYMIVDSYEISNQYELLSVPLQVGYKLVDAKFNWLIVGGVANEFLIGKKVEDTAGNYESVRLSPGKSGIANYRLNGMLGTELGYFFSDHYYLSVQPQISQGLTNQGKNSRPTFFEIGVRFKYKIN